MGGSEEESASFLKKMQKTFAKMGRGGGTGMG
jgi:hypothetical protein